MFIPMTKTSTNLPKNAQNLHSPKFNSSPRKIDGWKTSLSFWDGKFSGSILNFQGVYPSHCHHSPHIIPFSPHVHSPQQGRKPMVNEVDDQALRIQKSDFLMFIFEKSLLEIHCATTQKIQLKYVIVTYCCYPVNNRRFTISTGAGFLSATVWKFKCHFLLRCDIFWTRHSLNPRHHILTKNSKITG